MTSASRLDIHISGAVWDWETVVIKSLTNFIHCSGMKVENNKIIHP